jgi:DNA-binding Lrp family transcriptional regulator
MRLTPRQKTILWAIQHNAEASVGRLQKLTGCREHTIRDAVSRLTAAGVIYRMYPINVRALGFNEWVIYFSLATKRERERQALLDAIIASDRAALLVQIGGDYEYELSVCVRNVDEVVAFLDDLGRRFGEMFYEKQIAMRYCYTGFGRKYLTGRKAGRLVTLGPVQKIAALDDLDHRILKTLCRKHSPSYADVARELAMAQTTLHYRIEKLKKQGVLADAIYALTPQLFGWESFRLLIYARSVSIKFRCALERFCADHLQVVNLVRSVGAWDYALTVEVENASAVPHIVQELQFAFGPQINAVRTLPQFLFLKGQNYPFEARPV